MFGSLSDTLIDPLIDTKFEFDDWVSVLKARNAG